MIDIFSVLCLLWWKGLHGSDIQFKFVLIYRGGIQSVVFFDEWSVDLTRPYSSFAVHDLQFSAVFLLFRRLHLLPYVSKQKETSFDLYLQAKRGYLDIVLFSMI